MQCEWYTSLNLGALNYKGNGMQIEALCSSVQTPPMLETFGEWINNHRPFGLFMIPFFRKDCQTCQSSLAPLLYLGDVFALCILFYNPQRWNFIAQQCFCLWHSPKQDLLLPRQMWLESMMPFKQSLSKQIFRFSGILFAWLHSTCKLMSEYFIIIQYY